MKTRFIYTLFLLAGLAAIFSSNSGGPVGSGNGGNTGAPFDGICSNCHSPAGAFSPSVSITVLSGATPVTSYTPGQTYTLRVQVSGGTRYGAQAVVTRASNNAQAGSLSGAGAGSAIRTFGSRAYLEHTTRSTTGTFTATWTAPAVGTGTVNIHAAGLAVDANGGSSGDDVANTSISLTEAATASIAYSGSPYCSDGSNPTPTITGQTGGTFSSSPTGVVFVSTSTGQINLASTPTGTYTINYSYNGGTATASTTITINPRATATITYPSASYCTNGTNPTPTRTGTLGGTYSAAPAGLSFVSTSTGVINLAASSPGTYTVSYTTGTSCPTVATASVSITSGATASINYDTSYCRNAANPTPAQTGQTGGTYSATPAGLSFVSTSTGQINLVASSPGTYTVSYIVSGACGATVTDQVSILNTPNPQINYDTSYCQNVANPTPVSSGLTGGTFSASPAGLVFSNSASGQINLAGSTPGAYTITYAIGGACGATVTDRVSILTTPNPQINYDTSYCRSGANPTPVSSGLTGGAFSASPAGLVFANSSTGQINLASTPVGTYTIQYAITGACPATVSDVVSISAAGNASITYNGLRFCKNAATNPAPTFNGQLGGTFSVFFGGGLSINSSTGVINLAASATGPYAIIYSIGGACPASDTVTLEVAPVDSAQISYAADSACQNSLLSLVPTITGNSAGTFSAAPAGLNIAAGSGSINLLASQPGLYAVFYQGGGACPMSDADTILVLPADSAAIAYGDTLYCSNAGPLTADPILSGATGGAFSISPAMGLPIDAASGQLALAGAASGSYVVSYRTNGICPTTATAQVSISVCSGVEIARTDADAVWMEAGSGVVFFRSGSDAQELVFQWMDITGRDFGTQAFSVQAGQPLRLEIPAALRGMGVLVVRSAQGAQSYKIMGW